MRYLQSVKEQNKVKLDLKDRKILGVLSFDARMPATQIAKKVGLSRDAVQYRIDKYEEKGVIQGYRTIVDISKFGYQNYHLFIKLKNPPKETEYKIITKLSSRPFIRAILKFTGNYDLEIAMVAKDTSELDKFVTLIISDCTGFLQEYELLTLIKTYTAETFPPNFSDFKITNKFSKKKIKLDEKDIKILKLIAESGKMPLFEIAGRLKISIDSVSYRIKNMLKSGIIVKFAPVINYSSLDYSLYTLLFNINELDEEKEKSLKSFLLKDKNVLWAVKSVGKFNILAYLLVKNVEDLQNTLLELRNLFPKQVNNYEIMIAYEEYKFIYFPSKLF